MNRDIELLKVQLLADYYHNQFNLALSFLLTGLITLAIAFMMLVYEGRINLLTYYFSLGVVFVSFFYLIRRENNGYSENMNFIDNLLRQVENGELLPSLRELKKTKIPKEKQKTKK